MASGRLRVLMPSIVDPEIRRGGAWTVTRGLVELFRRTTGNAEITTLVPPAPSWRWLRQATAVACAPWTRVPAKIRFLSQRAFRDKVQRTMAREPFDLLVINGSDLLWCLDDIAPPRLPALAVVHNQESKLFEDQVCTALPRLELLKKLLLADVRRLDAFELARLRRVRAAIFLSERDAEDFARRIPALPHLTLAPQFPEPPHRIQKRASDGLDLGLMANFDWWPNREGVRWFISEILARLPDDVRLHLFGYRSADAAYARPRVVAHGFVDDLRQVWATCDWMVIPIRHGSGVSVKAAESLYHGMPLLSTSFGLRGLPTVVHPQVVRLDTAEEWVSFLSSPSARTLSRSRLPLDVSRPFDLEANVSRFAQFLSHVCRLEAPVAVR